MTLDRRGILLTIQDREARQTARFETRLEGANEQATVRGSEPLGGAVYSLKGDGAAVGQPVPAFHRVRYESIYPGIDLVFYGQERLLEYDFVVAPGADPAQIRMAVTGPSRPRLSGSGDLVLDSPAGEVRWKKPVLYQERDGRREPVPGRFLLARNEVRFAVGPYDRSRPLIIDPVLGYSSFVGGSGNEAARSIATDAAGNIYIAGFTTSENLPKTSGTVQTAYGGGNPMHQDTGDAFVAKFNAAGELVYMTYLGGDADDVALGLAVDSDGNAYVTGFTNSKNFRTTPSSYQTTFKGEGRPSEYHEGGDAFVVKLNPAGSTLIFSTFLGGIVDDRGLAIAIDKDNNVYIAGQTISPDFPTTAGVVQPAYKGGTSTDIIAGGDVFVSKLNATGSQLLLSTYLGGINNDSPAGIAVDAAGNIYLAGATMSADFPTTSGAPFRTYGGAYADQPIFQTGDAFAAKLDPGATRLIYSTFYGGSRDDAALGMALAADGSLYITGLTSSSDLKTTANAAQPTYGGPAAPLNGKYFIYGDGFVAKFNPDGSLEYSTYFGGSDDDAGWDIAVDASGNAIVVGQTNSADIKLSADALQSKLGGAGGQSLPTGDGLILKLSPTGSSFLYASLFGGAADDAIAGVVLDSSGNVLVTGSTVSMNFPTTSTAAIKQFAGQNSVGLLAGDSFLAKFTGFSSAATTIAAVANAASYTTAGVAPGEIVTIYGTGIGPKTLTKAGLTTDKLLETTTAGTRILFDGVPAPIIYVFETQSAVIVPYSVAGKAKTDVQVEWNGARSPAFSIPVVEAAPGLFSADSSGKGPGAILNEDGTVNSPQNPIAAGKIVVLFGTGEGQTTPAGIDGKFAIDVYPKPVASVSVTVGGKPAEVLYAGAAPYEVAGVLQVNIRLPQDVGPGNQDVVLTVGGKKSLEKDFTVAVK